MEPQSEKGGTNESNPACALMGHGPCDGKITGEHYISRSLLNRLSPDASVTIVGTPWTAGGAKTVGKSALTANVICEGHNSGLSSLDALAARFLRHIQEAQLNLASQSPRSQTHTFDGLKLERWFLKVAFTMWRSGNFGTSDVTVPGAPPPLWAELLTGRAHFPAGWGLHLQRIEGPFATTDKQFSVMPLTGSDGSGIKAVHFEMARVPFWLLMGNADDPAYWGQRRPRQIDLGNDVVCHSLRLLWPDGEAGEAVTLLRIADAPTSPG